MTEPVEQLQSTKAKSPDAGKFVLLIITSSIFGAAIFIAFHLASSPANPPKLQTVSSAAQRPPSPTKTIEARSVTHVAEKRLRTLVPVLIVITPVFLLAGLLGILAYNLSIKSLPSPLGSNTSMVKVPEENVADPVQESVLDPELAQNLDAEENFEEYTIELEQEQEKILSLAGMLNSMDLFSKIFLYIGVGLVLALICYYIYMAANGRNSKLRFDSYTFRSMVVNLPRGWIMFSLISALTIGLCGYLHFVYPEIARRMMLHLMDPSAKVSKWLFILGASWLVLGLIGCISEDVHTLCYKLHKAIFLASLNTIGHYIAGNSRTNSKYIGISFSLATMLFDILWLLTEENELPWADKFTGFSTGMYVIGFLARIAHTFMLNRYSWVLFVHSMITGVFGGIINLD